MDTTTTPDGILEDFQDWAQRHGRRVNIHLIEALRSSAPGGPGGADGGRAVWRAGDVSAAVDRAIGADPLVFLLASETLEDTLDGWFRFLRNTGRLGVGSADVGVLRREARRAARRAARAAKDTAAALAQDLLDCWEEPEEDWIDDDDPRHENIRVLQGMGISRLDVLVRTWGALPDPERASEEGWTSGYMARLRNVAQAISPSVPLEGLLLPSPEIAEELVRACPPGTFAGAALESAPRGPGRTVPHSAFVSVWFDARIARLVDTVDGRAVPGRAYFGDADESATRRTLRAVRVARSRIDDQLQRSEHGAGLVCLLVRSLWDGPRWVSVQETVDATPWPWFVAGPDTTGSRCADDVREAIREMEEAGVLLVEGEKAKLTSFGVWAVDSWLRLQFDPNSW